MPQKEKLRVLVDENGKRYAKQFTPSQLEEHLAKNPSHTLIR